MTLLGTVVNGSIVLDSPQQLPEGARVEVVVRKEASETTEAKPSLAERLLRLAGTVKDLPSDMARNHDHYLHGAPKR
jgi:hypothetical protein